MNETRYALGSANGRWVVFAAICASSMAFIDGSALNVALGALQADLNATGADFVWIVNAYLLMLASLILIGGALGDQWGRVRVFRIGILLFAAASVACGLAPSTGLLIIGRAVQGIGGALMVPGSLALIAALIADNERGQAIGIWSAVTTMAGILGPVVGGVAVEQASWRWVFMLNVPFALLALFALSRIPDAPADPNVDRRIDVWGAALITLSLAGLTYGLVTIGESGLNAAPPTAFGALLLGVIGLVAFVYVEATGTHPMVDLKLFRSRAFSGANAMTVFLYGALGGALLYLPLNLTQVQGYRADLAGLMMTPTGVILALMSPFTGRLVDRYGPRLLLTVGPLIVGAGFAALAFTGINAMPNDYWLTFFPPQLLIGIGLGITVAPLTTTVMTSV
ncbi:MAG: DHA2 family efflux MFS transporter permease subunit, partial [Armatimonadetes bacterium]|nr:DHA2 family efflux MFS transporter permease subunit [Anaerolineae bacterium]